MYNLAFAYLAKGRQSKQQSHFKEAAKLLHKIVAKDPSKEEPLFYLGMLYESGLGVD